MSRCFPVCGECDGRGRIWGRGPANEHKASPCPSCGGRGVLIPDELRKKVAVAIWTVDSKATPENYGVFDHLVQHQRNDYFMKADAVLSRLLEGAETVNWCEEHKTAAGWFVTKRTVCDIKDGYPNATLGPCRIVERQLLLPASLTIKEEK